MKEVTFTIETNSQVPKYSIFKANDIITTEVHCRANEFSVHWKSQIPKKVQKKYNKRRPISFM